MKKIILGVVLFTILSLGLNAQNIPPYVGIFQRFEGVSYLPKEGYMKKNTQAISITGLDFTLGKTIYFLGQIGYYAQMNPTNTLANYDEGWDWDKGLFLALGVGGYPLDKRSNGVGHAMTVSLSLAFKIPAAALNPFSSYGKYDLSSIFGGNSTISRTPDYNIYGELQVTYLYSFFKHLTLKAGINLGFGTAASYKNTILGSGILYGNIVNYGLNFGIAF